MTLSRRGGPVADRPARHRCSDQSDTPVAEEPVVQALLRVIEARGGSYEWHYRPPSQGIAEQRDFLLRQATADAVLYLDDDVWMEPWVLETHAAPASIRECRACGFVGAFPAGLTFRDDVRPEQQEIEFWEGRCSPRSSSRTRPNGSAGTCTGRRTSSMQPKRLPPGAVRLYKVAWVASCILYDRQKLLDVGGFSFWSAAAALPLRGGGAGAEPAHAALGRLRHDPVRARTTRRSTPPC